MGMIFEVKRATNKTFADVKVGELFIDESGNDMLNASLMLKVGISNEKIISMVKDTGILDTTAPVLVYGGEIEHGYGVLVAKLKGTVRQHSLGSLHLFKPEDKVRKVSLDEPLKITLEVLNEVERPDMF
jgi:hypothetical protein